MEHKTIEGSSNLASAAYDPDTETLEVRFKGSGIYSYQNVPKSVYASFMEAESKGKFFASAIKGNYKFVKGASSPT